jgi:hypothetical protein
MSGPTKFDLDLVIADLVSSHGPGHWREVLTRFAREMQARGLELAAENPNLPEVERIWTLRKAARIREGKS